MSIDVDSVRKALKDLGLGTKASNKRSAYVAMVCCGLRASECLSNAKSVSLGISEMIASINDGFPDANNGCGYAHNTRETVRDDTVKAFSCRGLQQRRGLR